jgi:hypothetical protein
MDVRKEHRSDRMQFSWGYARKCFSTEQVVNKITGARDYL